MENNSGIDSLKSDIKNITLLFLKISSIALCFCVFVLLISEITSPRNSFSFFFRDLLTLWGFVLVLIGGLIFLFYSSYSFGFDAIWTPQLQGEIQRDERTRQVTGWPRAITGGMMLILGIILLYYVLNEFWLA